MAKQVNISKIHNRMNTNYHVINKRKLTDFHDLSQKKLYWHKRSTI